MYYSRLCLDFTVRGYSEGSLLGPASAVNLHGVAKG